jgi:hypothetical protein
MKNREKTRGYTKKYYKNNTEKAKEISRQRYLKRNYGITIGQFESMFTAQKGVCAICGRSPKTRRLNIDHDHTSGKVRGLLCWFCNKKRIGRHTQKDAWIFRKCAEYLERERAVGL